MAWNKPVTNTKPATQTDTGPYNTTRAKSDDGRYTANPNFSGSEEERQAQLQQLSEEHPYLSQTAQERSQIGFNKGQLSFDERVSTPFFTQIAPFTIGKLLNTDKITPTTSYEDQNLKIDVFVGEANPRYAYMICDPNVKTIDLKTIKRGIGPEQENKDFYNNPKIELTIRKIHSRKPHIVHNQLAKGFNQQYAIQIPYSSTSLDNTKVKDISAVKLFYLPSSTMKNVVEGHNEAFIDNCAKHLVNLPAKEYVQEQLSNAAHEKGYAYDLDERNPKITKHIITTPTEAVYFEHNNRTDDWSVRVEFEANPLIGKEGVHYWRTADKV